MASIERICATVEDARQLRLQVLQELRRLIGFDAYAWLLTDPETSVGAAPIADVPRLADLPQLIRLKYLTEVNRWTRLDARVALLREATDGDPSRSLVWRELLDGYGIADVASVVFRDRFGCWGFLDLWRSHPFSPAEAAFLREQVELLTTALRRCQAATFVPHARRAERRLGPLVLMLSPDLQVRGQTPETQAYLRTLVPPSEGRAPVPAGAYNVAAQLVAVEEGVDPNAPLARVHVADGLWVTLRAARIGDPGSDTDIAVTIEESSPIERIGVFARAFGLTGRESDLLGHLTTGADTRGLARLMFLSEHTVQDHLKSIFAKTGTHSRREAVSRVLGT